MSVLVFAMNIEHINIVVSIVTITQTRYVFIILVSSVITIQTPLKIQIMSLRKAQQNTPLLLTY